MLLVSDTPMLFQFIVSLVLLDCAHAFVLISTNHAKLRPSEASAGTGSLVSPFIRRETTSHLSIRLDLGAREREQLLQTAEAAARAAGSIIKENLGCANQLSGGSENEREKLETTMKFNIKDVVTRYDKQAQATVEEIIRSRYPNHKFLGEENVAAGSEASELALNELLKQTTRMLSEASSTSYKDDDGFLWICDPIDGTANFASGLPMCGVTIALVHKGSPLLGVIYDPHRDELFSAMRGHGATMNNASIHVTTAVTDIKDAIINAGCPADPNAFETSMRGMLALNKYCRGLRIIACSAMTLPWIACGRLSAHFGYDLSSWDLVAGALIVQEAGGCVTGLDGSPYTLQTRNMLCSNGKIHEDILKILKASDAVSFERAI